MTKKGKKLTIAGIVYTLLFAGSSAKLENRDKDTKCGGIERWTEKVVIDNKSDLIRTTPKVTTIAWLNSVRTDTIAITKTTERNDALETQVYTIKDCFISKAFIESDNDIHLAVEDGHGHTMVCEIPDPKCPEAKQSAFIGDYKNARATFLKYQNIYNHHRFDITGVLFIDKKHPVPPIGDWPNNVELHPVIAIKETSQY